jgi:hypothetical protein
MDEIADCIWETLRHTTPVAGSRAQYITDADAQTKIQDRVKALLERYPLYPDITL